MNPAQRETLSYFQGAVSTIVKKINSRVKQSAVINQFKPAGFCVSKLMLPKIFILFFFFLPFSDILTISSSSISATSTGQPVSNTMASSTVFRKPTKYTTQISFLH